jgi:hypothetical protein
MAAGLWEWPVLGSYVLVYSDYTHNHSRGQCFALMVLTMLWFVCVSVDKSCHRLPSNKVCVMSLITRSSLPAVRTPPVGAIHVIFSYALLVTIAEDYVVCCYR